MNSRKRFEYACDVCNHRVIVLESEQDEVSIAQMAHHAANLGWQYNRQGDEDETIVCPDCQQKGGVSNKQTTSTTAFYSGFLLLFIVLLTAFGLWFYSDKQENYAQISKASAKLASFIMERDETADISAELVEKIEKNPAEFADKIFAVGDVSSPTPPLNKPQFKVVAANIESSFYECASGLGFAGDKIIFMGNVLAEKLNLSRDLRKNDRLKIVVDRANDDDIQAIFLDNKGQHFLALKQDSDDGALHFVNEQPPKDKKTASILALLADFDIKKAKKSAPALSTKNRKSTKLKIARQPVQKTPSVHGIYAFYTGTIQATFVGSAQKIGLGIGHVMKLKRIFSYSVNFRKLRKGDKFTVIFNKDELKQKKGKATIIAAEIIAGRKKHQRFRFKDEKGKASYYATNNRKGPQTGRKAVKIGGKGFIRYPLRYRRISSHFNLKRRHPISGRIRPHKGTDFAANTGTPVMTTEDGVIVYSGWQRGYGNVIKIDHYRGKYTTIYAHLNRIHRRASRKGQKVKRRQVIGYVGSTGGSTGPHLHYEFRVRGRAVDALKVKLPRGDETIFVKHTNTKELARFRRVASLMQEELEFCRNQYKTLARAK